MEVRSAGPLIIVNRRGTPIRSLEDWERLAGPASPRHWVEHRSAPELARAWLNGDAPRALMTLLDAHAVTSGVALERVIGEAQTPFDRCGRPRKRGRGLGRSRGAGGRADADLRGGRRGP